MLFLAQYSLQSHLTGGVARSASAGPGGATTPGKIGRGCSTAWFIDEDCDGYGVGVRSSGVYGWDVLGVGDMPDADDNDPAINTPASVLAAYDANKNGRLDTAELKRFLAEHRGYTANHIIYIAPNGSDATGKVDDPGRPYATYGNTVTGAGSVAVPGDVIVYRGGTYVNPDIGGGAPPMKSGTAGHPIVVLSMPGEAVHLQTNATRAFVTAGGTSWVIVDGFTVDNPTNSYLGTGWSCGEGSNAIFRNIESQRFWYINCIPAAHDITVEHSIFHHQGSHDFYMGANTNAATNIVVQDNIFYAAGWQEPQHNLNGQYGGLQFNGRCISGCVFQRNISHSNSNWGLSFIEGVSNATVANNLIFNNGGHGVVMQIYQGACAITGTSTEGGTICPYDTNNNVFVNNTIWVGKYRADGAHSGDVYPQVFAGFTIANNLAPTGPASLCVKGGVSVPGVNCTMEQIFRNNIIVTYDGQTFRFDQAPADKWIEKSKFEHNVIYHLGNGPVATRYAVGSGIQNAYPFAQFERTYGGGTNISGDPLFLRADPAEYGVAGLFNLRLQPTSPGRGVGTTVTAPADDVTRAARTSPPDAGAYQYAPPVKGAALTAPSSGSDVRLLTASAGPAAVSTAGRTGSANVTWTRQPATPGWPGFNGWLTLLYDSVSRRILHYGILRTSTSIYSSDMFAYDSSMNKWSHLGGNGTLASTCPDSTSSWPGDRHPVGQITVDARRHLVWLFGGVCQGILRQDMYFMTLNADPAVDRWRKVAIGTIPLANLSSSMVYVPDTDVIFLFGSDGGAQKHDNWIYCPTDLNPTRGTLTSNQSAAGCARADDWTEIPPTNGVQPPGVGTPGMVYEPRIKKVIEFGGSAGGGAGQNDTWAYDVPARTWTRKALNTAPPPPYAGTSSAQPAMAYNPATGRILFRQTSNAGAPADWQYDPAADTWTRLTSLGGPTFDVYMTYDLANQKLVAFGNGAAGAEVWVGVVR
jgi:hypothetical protein